MIPLLFLWVLGVQGAVIPLSDENGHGDTILQLSDGQSGTVLVPYSGNVTSHDIAVRARTGEGLVVGLEFVGKGHYVSNWCQWMKGMQEGSSTNSLIQFTPSKTQSTVHVILPPVSTSSKEVDVFVSAELLDKPMPSRPPTPLPLQQPQHVSPKPQYPYHQSPPYQQIYPYQPPYPPYQPYPMNPQIPQQQPPPQQLPLHQHNPPKLPLQPVDPHYPFYPSLPIDPEFSRPPVTLPCVTRPIALPTQEPILYGPRIPGFQAPPYPVIYPNQTRQPRRLAPLQRGDPACKVFEGAFQSDALSHLAERQTMTDEWLTANGLGSQPDKDGGPSVHYTKIDLRGEEHGNFTDYNGIPSLSTDKSTGQIITLRLPSFAKLLTPSTKAARRLDEPEPHKEESSITHEKHEHGHPSKDTEHSVHAGGHGPGEEHLPHEVHSGDHVHHPHAVHHDEEHAAHSPDLVHPGEEHALLKKAGKDLLDLKDGFLEVAERSYRDILSTHQASNALLVSINATAPFFYTTAQATVEMGLFNLAFTPDASVTLLILPAADVSALSALPDELEGVLPVLVKDPSIPIHFSVAFFSSSPRSINLSVKSRPTWTGGTAYPPEPVHTGEKDAMRIAVGFLTWVLASAVVVTMTGLLFYVLEPEAMVGALRKTPVLRRSLRWQRFLAWAEGSAEPVIGPPETAASSGLLQNQENTTIDTDERAEYQMTLLSSNKDPFADDVSSSG